MNTLSTPARLALGRFYSARAVVLEPIVFLVISAATFVASAIDFNPPITLQPPTGLLVGSFGEAFGAGLAAVPDVTADGKAYIAVAATDLHTPSGPDNAGRVYLFDGVTGQLLRELKSPQQMKNGRFGAALAGIDDLNGNGSGEVLVGTGAEHRLYVFDGATGKVIHTFSGLLTEIDGTSAVPDVNGDGVPDIAVASVNFSFSPPRGTESRSLAAKHLKHAKRREKKPIPLALLPSTLRKQFRPMHSACGQQHVVAYCQTRNLGQVVLLTTTNRFPSKVFSFSMKETGISHAALTGRAGSTANPGRSGTG